MSVEENKAVVRRLIEEGINKGNLEIFPEIYTPDFVLHGPDGQDIKGPESYKQMIAMFLGAFPDFILTIEDLIAEGDRVVARITSSGTHQGELMGIPATGKHYAGTVTIIYRFTDGKPAEAWEFGDPNAIFQQLGVIPPASN